MPLVALGEISKSTFSYLNVELNDIYELVTARAHGHYVKIKNKISESYSLEFYNLKNR